MLPPLAELCDTLRVVALPMRARFRGVQVREVALLRGPEGWTEFSPFVEYDDDEAATWLAAAIDFGWQSQPEPVRDRVPVNATVPAIPATAVPELLDRFPGTRTAKVKVAERGQALGDDLARVRAVRQVLGPQGRVRVDANGAWNLDEAEHAVRALEQFDLEYVEQPCATVTELAQLRERIGRLGIPIAADESIRKSADPLAVTRAGAADLIVVKAAPLGGVRRALQIVAETGLPAVVSSALDSAVGLSMGATLAAALAELPYDCGLGTGSLFTADVGDVTPRDGTIPAGRAQVDPAAVDRLAAAPDRVQWWAQRIARCHRVLSDRSRSD